MGGESIHVIARRALFIAVLASLLVSGGAAGAAERAPGTSGGETERSAASYRDRTIRLDGSWDGAGACSVTSEAGVRCFESAEEMAAATGSRAGSRPQARESTVSAESEATVSAASVDCNGIPYYWFYLYEHPNFGGRIIQFNDVNFWQNLSHYGFDNRASAYWNDTDCYVYLADGAWGGGAIWAIPPVWWQATIGWWDNRPSSLYIAG